MSMSIFLNTKNCYRYVKPIIKNFKLIKKQHILLSRYIYQNNFLNNIVINTTKHKK
ncbi:hypothetical protein NBO_583g0002 [Nosema bombycis CQ1]|uniref:Uncharacterized protein n=1 Tax=Nosema bombycis (strain CQ1 / CVCC 102059) TaxID=578461 RepID=R0MD81_NOSB1|nr:hypothetical protein NBO_583g0002 [Nosema bombycis CQ1]|eukprot:EOB12030.1 hypothetical protein NBO_583g0002 [Nosema bombycis CQ1]